MAVTSAGNMLVIPLEEIPQMPKGKGNKIIGIPSAKVVSREEYMSAITCVQDGESLVIYSGQRHKTMKPAEVDEYSGERGRRGSKLPRGYRDVARMDVLRDKED